MTGAVARPSRLLFAAFVALACAIPLIWPAQIVTVASRVPDRPAGALPWLHSDGGQVLDDQERQVLLRGFNVDTLIRYGDRGPYPFSAADADLMRSAGFDVVRLPIAWGMLEPVRGRVDGAYLDRIAAVVRMLERRAIYTVIDMHFSPAFSPRFGGAGAPAWAYIPGVPGFEKSNSWAFKYLIAPDAQAATTYFFTSSDWQKDYAMVWRAVAARFRDDPGVAAYDLRNEPHPLPIPPGVFERLYLWPFYGRLMDAVRQVDPNHLLMVENSMLNNLPTAVPRLQAADAVYAPHMYYGSFGWPLYDGRAGPLDSAIGELRREAGIVGAPLWIGETGIDHRAPFADHWIDTSLDAYDTLGAGWAWWEWRGRAGWGVFDARTGGEDLDLLRRLARPYVEAGAVGVRAEAADGVAGRLAVAVDPAHGLGGLVVGWSSATLPAPAVAGSCVSAWSWSAADARITIELVPGAGCSISITAGGAGSR